MTCRIPASLQAIFLASNGGAVVNEAPSSASMEFVRNVLKQHGGNSTTSSKSSTYAVNKKRNPTKTSIRVVKPIIERAITLMPSTNKTPLKCGSPQDFLDAMLLSRGYSCERYEALKTAYFNNPTPLQKASYQTNLIQCISSKDSSTLETLRQILPCGISVNPCNAFSESFAHIVCRRGRHDILQLFLAAGGSAQCADDYGRTPLHDACWAAEPSFSTVELLLQQDARLLHMKDARGSLPLSYVHKEHWTAWINFLESKKDVFWKPRFVAMEGEQGPPDLALQEPNTRPLPDPANALPADLACLVASGKIHPREVMLSVSDSYADDDYSESSDRSSSDFDSDDDTEDDFSIGEIKVVKADKGKCNTGSLNGDESLCSSTADESKDDFDSDSMDSDGDHISAGMAAAMLAAQLQANAPHPR